MTTCHKLSLDVQAPSARNRFDLILFDCDGTLVDSEYLNILAVSQVLQDYGFGQYTQERIIKEFTGWRFSAMVKKIRKDTDYDLPENITWEFVERVRLLAPEHMRKIDGVIEMVRSAQSFAKTYIVSNGQRDNVLASLEFSDLIPLFSKDRIINGTMAPHPKPAPDLFLLAARKAGISAGKTLVIEDSLTGVMSGLAAKMTVWGFCGTHHSPKIQEKRLLELGAEKAFHNMKDLSNALSY
ncbi:MAG: HAD-IA family hydrolase [Alphaproteobacteria bacterium]|nr:HAD-IA family hydrolase [Alphaproteobacteria bacterium]